MKNDNNNGFTLVELMVVVAILAILATIGIIVFQNVSEKSKITVQEYNIATLGRAVSNYIMIEGMSADQIFDYVKSGDTPDDNLSRYIELNWEVPNGPGDEDNSNEAFFVNWNSDKSGIVNWPSIVGNDLYANQALYITTDSNVDYDPNNLSSSINEYYRASMIIYFESDLIYIYYVDEDGNQSEKYAEFNKSSFE